MKQKKPKNILLLFTDQQRFDTIEELGNPIIKTPTLNQLVKEGIAFTRAYSPCPVCVPARFAMHTGQMPHRTDCVMNETMPEGRTSFMEILSENGYQTHGVGKMHFAFKDTELEALWGFNSRDISEEGGLRDDFKFFLEDNGYGHVHDPQGIRSEMYYTPQPSQLPAHLHNTAWVADRSIDFLKNRNEEQPFLLMSSFIKPHPPFESPTPWNKLYRGPEMPLPRRPINSEGLITYWNQLQNRYKYKDQGIDDHLIRSMKAAYYSTISFIDYQIGRLIAFIKEADLMENTVIVFSSDHGELLGDYNCFGKRSFLDSAARVPMIMRHPDLPKNIRCPKPVSLLDILPTFLQVAGVAPKEAYSGDSLIDIATGAVNREQIFGQYNREENGVYMAVTECFKYIYSAPDNKEWFFDLKIDPDETRSLSHNLMYVDRKEKLKQDLINYFQEEGYNTPIEEDDWKQHPVKQFPDDLDAFLLFQDPPSSIPDIPGYERNIKVNQTFLSKVRF